MHPCVHLLRFFSYRFARRDNNDEEPLNGNVHQLIRPKQMIVDRTLDSGQLIIPRWYINSRLRRRASFSRAVWRVVIREAAASTLSGETEFFRRNAAR